MAGALARGYDRKSGVALFLLVVVGATVGYRFSDLLDHGGGIDWLLTATWIWMAVMLVWRVSARHDLVLLASGLCGGAVIEWWGTNTSLWTYFTDDRPPLWILPAWPIATLCIDRMARLFDGALDSLEGRTSRRLAARTWRLAYYVTLPAFVVAMLIFAWPAAHHGSTLVVLAIMLGVTLHCPDPRRDVALLFAGSLLGIALEYWGTSRQCWTYYTGEVPPVVAVVAHGFAAIAFVRAAAPIERLLAVWQRRPRVSRAVRAVTGSR